MGKDGEYGRHEWCYHYKKNQYYLRIFTQGFEFVGKFSFTYGYYPRKTLPTDITHGQYYLRILPTNLNP